MSKLTNHQLIIRACTSLASATLCATIFLTINTNNAKASAMPLPVQNNVEKNVNQANYVLANNKLLNRKVVPSNSFGNDWTNINYKYDDSTNTLTIYGGTITDPLSIYHKFSDSVIKSITNINISGKLTLIGDATAFFSFMPNLTNIDGMKNVDTSQVTNMHGMFWSNPKLQTIDVGSLDTHNVTDMGGMFSFDSELKDINCENWVTDNVTDMGDMFEGCNSLTKLDLNNWNTSNVTNMGFMFEACDNLVSLEVDSWKTSKVTDMGWMFDRCKSLTKLDITNWDTSSVVDMSVMFQLCQSLAELDLSKWNTKKVASMSSMFNSCSSLAKLDISGFDTSNIGNKQDLINNNPVTAPAIDADCHSMLYNLPLLRELHLGSKINISDSGLDTPVNWVSVKDGTIQKPKGTEFYNSYDLAEFWNDKNYTETWVPGTKCNMKINYIDLDDNNKVIQTDNISTNPFAPIDYKSNFDKIVASLKDKHYEYIASEDKLPWSNGQIQLPDDVTDNTTYTVGFKHATSNVKDGDKNPITGDTITGLNKEIKQTIKYTGTPNNIADNLQTVRFTRGAKVDLITGKVILQDWNESEQSFKDVTSPKVAGYVPDIVAVKGATVKPTDSDITKEVKYSRGSYNININYVDSNTGKTIKTDKVSGNPDKVISYQDQLKQIMHDLPGYVIDKDKTTLPLDDNNDIKLPADVTDDKDYQVVLKHDSKTMHAGDKNPVTGKDEDSLTKTVTQTIKYTGTPTTISDNVQKVTFKRDADVDMVTGKLTYHDWDNKELSFKDVASPTVTGYDANPSSIKGATVTPDSSDITKTVTYVRSNYGIKINYVDGDDNDNILKTDVIEGNPEKAIAYKDKMNSIISSLTGYVLNKAKTDLPLNSDGDIQLPADVLGNKTYNVVLNHKTATMKPGDKNPVTGKDEDGLTKTITRTIKYTRTPTAISDKVQKVTFTRNATVDLVTGKLTYLAWDNDSQTFDEVVSPKVNGYTANPETVQKQTVKPADNDTIVTVKYTRGSYNINIDYVDSNTGKVVKTDKVSGNPDKVISYQDQLKQILHDLPGYVIDKDKTTLPLDDNNDIKLPDSVTGDKDYQVVLKHDSKTIHAGDKNPVTGKDEDGLTKTITQTIKYTGVPTDISDNVQKVTFKRSADVDMVTGKLTYYDWDNKELSFKDVASPMVTGYDANPSSVKGATVTPDSSDITKTVTYVRSNYGIKINYVDGDDNNNILKTDAIEGNPETPIAYKGKMTSIINSLTGYILNKAKTDLPLNENGDIQLPPDVLGSKTYNVVLSHKTVAMKPGDKNPVTGKDENGLTKVVTRTIKYTGTPNSINDKVQKVAFMRNATVDLVTGKLTYLDWDKDSQTLAEVVSPKVEGYTADPEIIKAQSVKPSDSDITKEVKYSRSNYNITINYVDSNDNDKVIKTDKVSGNPDKIISYQDQLKQILHDLPNYVIDKDKTTLPLDDNNDIKLPDSVTGDKDYQVVLKHDSKTMHAGDKNPVTGKDEDDLTKIITQTIKYTGMPTAISDNVQKITFKRDADVDMVTGKLTYHDWDNKELAFKDVTSPVVDGYDADIAVVKGIAVKPTDSDITKTVTYTKKEVPSYDITINYTDDTGKVVKTDKQKGKAGTTIQYHDKLQEIINQIGNGKYEIDKDKSSLPLDKNNDIKLPDDLTADHNYHVVLKHKIVTIKPGDKNPVTGEFVSGLAKEVKQIVKYTGANKAISDNVQTVKFTRNGQVDLVTGEVTYLEWNEKGQSFKDVDSPTVSGYTPDIITVKGIAVTADSSDIVKQVTYTKDKQDNTNKNDPDYEITIDYQDENGKTIKTDKQKGKANSTIPYKDRMQEIINSIAKNGYEVDWSKSNLPVDSDGNIKLGAITNSTNYKLVLKHKMVTFKHDEKNPFTGKEDPNLENKVTQTIKYLHSGKDLPNNVQELTFTRDAQVDMITGKVKYLTWHEGKQTFKDITSPAVYGYKPDLATVKGRTVTGDSKNIIQLVTYNKAKVVQTGLDLVQNEQSTILGTIVAAFVGILTYFGILKKKDKKD